MKIEKARETDRQQIERETSEGRIGGRRCRRFSDRRANAERYVKIPLSRTAGDELADWPLHGAQNCRSRGAPLLPILHDVDPTMQPDPRRVHTRPIGASRIRPEARRTENRRSASNLCTFRPSHREFLSESLRSILYPCVRLTALSLRMSKYRGTTDPRDLSKFSAPVSPPKS